LRAKLALRRYWLQSRSRFWHALAWASEMLPGPRLTRNQVELMRIDTVSSPELPGFSELEISPLSVEATLQKMLSNSH
jgi:NADH dehydrogenase